MAPLSNEPNTWKEVEQHEGNVDENTLNEVELRGNNIDKETETYVGVRDVLRIPIHVDEGDRRGITLANYLRISKQEGPVIGQFNLDLSLPPPPQFPGIASDIDPKNLTLHTKSGPVTAEIWIRHDRSTKSKRVSLDLCSDGGIVRAIVHDSSSPDKSSRTLPFLDMELRANYGDVFVSLPRCFRGPIIIRTGDDRISFSPAFGERTTLISDVSGVRVYFVGDRPCGKKWGNGDNGRTVEDSLDELSVDGKYTSVRVNWDGEEEEELPLLMPDGWTALRSGAERFFTSGRVR